MNDDPSQPLMPSDSDRRQRRISWLISFVEKRKVPVRQDLLMATVYWTVYREANLLLSVLWLELKLLWALYLLQKRKKARYDDPCSHAVKVLFLFSQSSPTTTRWQQHEELVHHIVFAHVGSECAESP